ncbi:hypothetical protein [Calderihabitans maritimus]|uniref:Uncharacterized protein n=1 Tax=Calderihabitans maritimus TaxID=1246530 RepID=A0A1Z5HQ78_9FIRM|nr:hypothetical protein [Calderihabitans maritimus]GAW91471.1 hypothetical protein KKC1_06330 [Calderihabitans maritimus]
MSNKVEDQQSEVIRQQFSPTFLVRLSQIKAQYPDHEVVIEWECNDLLKKVSGGTLGTGSVGADFVEVAGINLTVDYFSETGLIFSERNIKRVVIPTKLICSVEVK